MVSKGEQLIESFLQEKNFKYEKEKTFEDLKKKAKLRFDFYIPEYWTLIEVDGEQHNKVGFYHPTHENLRQSLKRDKRKDEYCIKKLYKLIRIPYNKLDLLTADILEAKIKTPKYGKVYNLENLY